jgi:hypothetical protein
VLAACLIASTSSERKRRNAPDDGFSEIAAAKLAEDGIAFTKATLIESEALVGAGRRADTYAAAALR